MREAQLTVAILAKKSMIDSALVGQGNPPIHWHASGAGADVLSGMLLVAHKQDLKHERRAAYIGIKS